MFTNISGSYGDCYYNISFGKLSDHGLWQLKPVCFVCYVNHMLCLCIYTNKNADDNAIGAVQYCRGYDLSVALS